MEAPPTLTDGVVVLRVVREGDRAAVLAAMRDPLVRRWLNMPAEPGDGHFDALLRTVEDGFGIAEHLNNAGSTKEQPMADLFATRGN